MAKISKYLLRFYDEADQIGAGEYFITIQIQHNKIEAVEVRTNQFQDGILTIAGKKIPVQSFEAEEWKGCKNK